MKRMKSHMHLLVGMIVILMAIPASAQETEEKSYVTLEGSVKDKSNAQEVEYANVIVKGTQLSTVTNADGKFTLKVDSCHLPITLEVSHIGYKKHIIQVPHSEDKRMDIRIEPYSFPIDQITIYPNEAKQMVKMAIQNIAQNYLTIPTYMQGFHRETVQKKKRYINISEAITETYKTSYTLSDVQTDKASILKGKRILSHKASDTLAVKMAGGPTLGIYLDIVKNHEILFAEEVFDDYQFEMTSTEIIDGKLVYAISFSPRSEMSHAIYKGILYIDPNDWAFVRAEFKLSMKDKNKATQMILASKPNGLKFKLQEVAYIVSYKEEDGKRILSYIRNSIQFKCDWKQKLFATGYTVVSETVFTDRQENPRHSPKNKSFRRSGIVYDEVPTNWNPEYWEEYNILEPTESLEKAIKKLKKKNISNGKDRL